MKKIATVLSLTLGLAWMAGVSGCAKGCSKTEDTQTTAVTATPTESTAPEAATTAAATAPGASSAPSVGGADLTPDSNGLSKATVVMKTSKGTIKFKLYSKDAPNTVKRFVELVNSKFYNGLAFHRVVENFVVQTGDPLSKDKNNKGIGTGGSGTKLKAEFNGRRHVRGTVAMARAADVDSADSQFYVALGVFPHLDNNYTVFGQVVDYGDKVGDKDVISRITQWDEISEMHVE